MALIDNLFELAQTTSYELVTDPGMLASALAARPKTEPVPLDTETTGLFPYTGDRMLCGSLWFDGRAWVFPVEIARPIVEACFQGLTVFHNANFDRAVIARGLGLEIDDGLVIDTLTVDWCLRESWPHALKEIGARLWGHDEKLEQMRLNQTLRGMTIEEAYKARRAEVGRSERAADSKEWARAHAAAHPKRTRADLTLEEWGPYAAKDAELTWRLYQHHLGELAELDGTWLSVREALPREHAVDAFYYRLQRTGIRVNTDRAEAFAAEAERRLADIAGDPIFEGINVGSSPQLAELVYGRWGFECTRFTDTGERSTDKKALGPLAWHPGVALALRYRKESKVLSAFYRPILEYVADDGRVHPSFRSHGTETGRPSCSAPNVMQLPREKTNRRVRPLFEPEPGMELVEFDLDQAELRIGAWLSGEHSILEILESGGSIYQEVADTIGRDRQTAKTLCLSAQYGVGARTLADTLALGTGERPDPFAARRILDAYWRRFPRLKRAIDDYARQWERQGYLLIGERWPGRLRHYHGPFGPEKSYAAFNSKVQGGQAEFVKDVLLDLEGEIAPVGRIVLTVYDSIVAEVEKDAGHKVGEALERITWERNPWDVPLRWSRKDWEPVPCWLTAPGMWSWLCQLPFGHQGACDYVPFLDE